MCEESSSFDLTPYDVAAAITAVDRLLVEQAKETGGGEFTAEDVNVETLSSGQTSCCFIHAHTRETHSQLMFFRIMLRF